jgi:hypothetical protein
MNTKNPIVISEEVDIDVIDFDIDGTCGSSSGGGKVGAGGSCS